MTTESMQDVLEGLGITVVSIRGNELQAHCPGHKDRTGKEDKNPSWYINTETGAHICFSCQFKGSLTSLINHVQGLGDLVGIDAVEQAKKWLKSEQSLSKKLERYLDRRETSKEEHEVLDPAMLAAFTNPPPYALKSRGISAASAYNLGIVWDARTESWIIPVHDGLSHAFLGWQQKAFNGRFFKNYPRGMKKSVSLFGYKQMSSNAVILVESPLDVARLHSLGFCGVASYGTYISNQQINLIRGIPKLVVAMDNDDAGKEANNRLLAAMSKMCFEAWFFNYSHTDQKDVGGMSRDEVLSGLQNAQHFVTLIQGVKDGKQY